MSIHTRAVIAAVLSWAAVADAEARITTLRIDRIEPFAAGRQFGATGSYERVTGVARGELDVADRRNSGIVNLAKAPRNSRGMVEYETDFMMLRPTNPAHSNHTLLYEVNNRGRKFLLHWMLDAKAQAVSANNDPRDVADAGNGLFFRQGYTMLWSGWDPDAPKSNNGMTIRVPVASNAGQPIVQEIREELVSGTRGPLVENFRLSHAAATLDSSQAGLSVRRNEADARVVVPVAGWRYLDDMTIGLLPVGTKPLPGSLYELRYVAKNPKVLGIGFAATRDLVSFVRHQGSDDNLLANPAGRRIRHALGVGISQSGRYLRDHVAQGFNEDESGQQVFDGVLTHISGIGKLFLNVQFGEPGRTNTQHEDHLYPENAFPFTAGMSTDPVSGQRGALFRNDGFDPLLIEVNTSTEYWQKGASLLHTDPLGTRDLVLHPRSRVYMIAGTQHGGRVGLDTAPGQCVNPRNPHNPAPALRALLVSLQQWVAAGTVPPPSRTPTIAARTLVPASTLAFPALVNVKVPAAGNAVVLFGDWINPQAQTSKAYRPLVPATDADGNETSGIRLPDIAVPLATYTGWNLYQNPFPEGELCDRDGSYFAFPDTAGNATRAKDPRRAIAERYPTNDAYVDQVAKAARTLVMQRYLLQEDADAYVDAARKRNPLQ